MYWREKKLSNPKKQKKKKKSYNQRYLNTLCDKWRKKRKKEIREKKELNERLIKDRIIGDIRTLFEQRKEDYYKPKRVSYFWNNNYIEYEGNGDKSRNLSLDEYLKKVEPYLRNIITDLQNSDT